MLRFFKIVLSIIFIGAFFVGFVRSCLGMNPTAPVSSSGIKEISFTTPDTIQLKAGNSRYTWFSVDCKGDGISLYDISFVSTNESIATITFEKRLGERIFYCYINAIGEGTAKVYIESSDGIIKSEEITVTVTESATEFQSSVAENE